MRHEVIAAQLIRALRGKRSQLAFSRHLGYRCNVLYTWESGRRWPTAETFFKVALRSRIDLAGGLRGFLGTSPTWLNEDVARSEVVAQLLDELRGGTSIVELARRVGTNRVSVSRWLHAQAEPRLPELLRMIEAASSRLLDFIAIFIEPRQLPECEAAWRELEAQRKVAYGLPWSHAVLRALELAEYHALSEHREGWLAERLCIPLELERTCVEALASSRLIVRRRKRWTASKVLTVDTRANPEAGMMLKAHWAEVGKRRLSALEPNKRDLFSYNLFTISEADWERLRQLHIDYYQQLQSIVVASQPAERVVLANLQLLRLDEPLGGVRSDG
jgi:transcriptional regulator with XRE-family HTH domain